MAEQRARITIQEANKNGLHSRFQTNELENKTNGFIGELGFKQLLEENNIKYNQEIVFGKSDDQDFEINGEKIEIKTLVGNVIPAHHFLVNVNERQVRERIADYYIFLQLDKKEKILYIVGWISKDEFLSKAELKREGEVSYKMTAYSNVYILHIQELNPPEEFLNFITNSDNISPSVENKTP